eukprot:GDKJ01003025.1.p3 GENE.GDKJ01003025.1~~GDKJ01003025.1.p3  ORF type:complete len:179 (+),score=9.57 GDKJ01003025.1:3300-3836(+)
MIIQQIKENLITFVITTFVTLITIFSDKIVENIRFALNRANLRTSHYESLAKDISIYVFETENIAEIYEYGWTSKLTIQSSASGYNSAITQLRKTEYVVINSLHRYWNIEDVDRFKKIMETVRKIDFQIHSLNSESELILNGEKHKANPSKTKPITDKLKLLNKELQTQVTDFLFTLV